MRRRRGITIIIILLASALLAVVTLSVVAMGSRNLIHASTEADQMQALYAAEAGAREKLWEYKTGNTSPIAEKSLPNGLANYTVDVYPSGTGPNGIFIPADHHYIYATGRTPNGARRRVGWLVNRSNSNFNMAILAKQEIVVEEGCVTDTYNSTVGVVVPDYKPHLANIGVTESTGTVKAAGIIGMHSSGPKAKILGPNGSTRASVVTTGVQGTNYASFDNSGIQTTWPPLTATEVGRTTSGVAKKADGPLRHEWLLPKSLGEGEYEVVEAKNGGVVHLNCTTVPNNTVQKFIIKELVMEGLLSQLRLEVLPGQNVTCEIYIDGGAVKLKDGAIVNPLSKPESLQFNIAQGGGNPEVVGGAAAYYVIYAPYQEVVVQGAEIFGSIKADKVKVAQTGKVHFDECLQNASMNGAGSATVVSQQRF